MGDSEVRPPQETLNIGELLLYIDGLATEGTAVISEQERKLYNQLARLEPGILAEWDSNKKNLAPAALQQWFLGRMHLLANEFIIKFISIKQPDLIGRETADYISKNIQDKDIRNALIRIAAIYYEGDTDSAVKELHYWYNMPEVYQKLRSKKE